MNRDQLSAIIGGMFAAVAKGSGSKEAPKIDMLRDAMLGAAAAGQLSELFSGTDTANSKEAFLFEQRGRMRGFSFMHAFLPYLDAFKLPLTELMSGFDEDIENFDVDAWAKRTKEHFNSQRESIHSKVHANVLSFYNSSASFKEVDIMNKLPDFAMEDSHMAIEIIEGDVAKSMDGPLEMIKEGLDRLKA